LYVYSSVVLYEDLQLNDVSYSLRKMVVITDDSSKIPSYPIVPGRRSGHKCINAVSRASLKAELGPPLGLQHVNESRLEPLQRRRQHGNKDGRQSVRKEGSNVCQQQSLLTGVYRA